MLMAHGVVAIKPLTGFLLATVVACATGCGNTQQDASSSVPVSATQPAGLLRLSQEERARTTIETIPVERGRFWLSREFPATLRPNENELAEVATLIRGRVVNVEVDVGADVKKDDLLALLHSTDLGLAEGAYLKAKARLHEVDLAYKRAKGLYEAKAISLAELQRREAEMKTVLADTRENRNRLELLGVTGQELERLHREQTIKADVPIRAPFDGRVIMRNITRGEVVETHQTLFTVADLSAVWVVVSVPEKDVEYIQKNQTVDVIVGAYPHALLTGTITYISDVLDPATRTMKVRVTVQNPEKRLKPEMFALVRINAEVDPVLLTVPLEAVQNGPGGAIVFVQRNVNEFEARMVTLGKEQMDVVTVLNGLEAGEQVVTKGSFVLKSEMERHKIEPAP